MSAPRCQRCGAEPRDSARFCDACGSTLVAAPTTAAYKQVTALFADVVGSMGIAAALDAERLREIMTDLLERSATVARRFGAGSVEHTGDGVMALFGAPVALEDHAFRACLAALSIQQEANRLAAEVARRDGLELRMRVGLNSGLVIVGEIGSGALGYAATGETVGFAQRMESVAPPGGVMMSESTARLVEHRVASGEPEWVRIKGAAEPVRARRLLGVSARQGPDRPGYSKLVGRRWEMAVLDAVVDRTVGGSGGVVNVVGPPGIGKSRVAREAARAATGRGAEVFWVYCESHTSDVPFHTVSRLLRAGLGITDLDRDAARARVREQLPDADPQDLLLLDDLLGVADPDVPQPRIDPDARRRRLTALVNSVTLARAEPALFVIEDAHWMDPVSESLLADFVGVVPGTPTMVLVTFRPEYRGALVRIASAQQIALVPLDDSDITSLLGELLGPDRSVRELAVTIVERAAGNPFFAEETVRELAQRGILDGRRGAYVTQADATDVNVPPTVHAVIEARIDRLNPPAQRTLNAASVIGARFSAELLGDVGIDPEFDELIDVEMIDQVRSIPDVEYAFRHPLIRAVAYESQLKSDRAELHRRVAAAIESRDPAAVEENAALIAEHLEAAGELHAAYQWHMRAATWATSRDITAARQSWERAEAIADVLPEGPDKLSMRIAPRTMLCGIAWRLHANVAGERIDELRGLCAAAGDDASLAIGMAGFVIDQAFQGRIRQASALASEVWSLVEALGDPTLTVALSFPLGYAQGHGGGWSDVAQWSNRAIELADGDPSMGDVMLGSPLALAHVARGLGRCCLGLPGWEADMRRGPVIARDVDPFSCATAITYVYFPGITLGALAADDRALCEVDEAFRVAQRSGDDMAVAFAQVILGVVLVHRDNDDDRDRGRQVLAEIAELLEHRGHSLSELRLLEAYLARENYRCGDRDASISMMISVVDEMTREGQLLSWGMPATGVLVETLLDRGAEGDAALAEAAIERLAAAPAADGVVMREAWLLNLRAQLARARGDDDAFRDYVGRYREMAESLGFTGHMARAGSLTTQRGG